MTEGYSAIVVVGVALGSFFLGRWAGAREERRIWTTAALNAPDDHVRSRGRDYTVMLLNSFYRDYYNPLAGLRFSEAHRDSKARDGCGVSASERASACASPDKAKVRHPPSPKLRSTE